MKKSLLLFPFVFAACAHVAPKGYVQPASEEARPADKASWTYNLDLKDPDLAGLFLAREIIDGKYKTGPVWSPFSVYRVDAGGWATRWAHAGVLLLTNTEGTGITFGPSVGVDVVKFTAKPQVQAAGQQAAPYLWKPLGLTALVLTIDGWVGAQPFKTKDEHWYHGGFGFRLSGKFGGIAKTISDGQKILTGGL